MFDIEWNRKRSWKSLPVSRAFISHKRNHNHNRELEAFANFFVWVKMFTERGIVWIFKVIHSSFKIKILFNNTEKWMRCQHIFNRSSHSFVHTKHSLIFDILSDSKAYLEKASNDSIRSWHMFVWYGIYGWAVKRRRKIIIHSIFLCLRQQFDILTYVSL